MVQLPTVPTHYEFEGTAEGEYSSPFKDFSLTGLYLKGKCPHTYLVSEPSSTREAWLRIVQLQTLLPLVPVITRVPHNKLP